VKLRKLVYISELRVMTVGQLFLSLRTDMTMEVYVTEVVSPHYFVVQPHGTELVEIMKAIG